MINKYIQYDNSIFYDSLAIYMIKKQLLTDKTVIDPYKQDYGNMYYKILIKK
jgi:hypothetical protein